MSDVKKDTLIINYLPQTLADEDFESMFSSVGELKACKIVRDRGSGYSFGFGFVEYVNDSDAAKAIELLNGTQLQNKTIKVAYSRQGEKIKGATLHVRNLPKTCSEKELETLFSVYGTIIQCRILTCRDTGESRGVGFVLYNTRDQAEAAMTALHGTMPPGCAAPLNVSFAQDKNRPPAEHQQTFSSYGDAVIDAYDPYEAVYGGYGVPFGAGLVSRVPRIRGRGRGIPRGRGRGGPMRNLMSAVRHRYNPMIAEGAYGESSASVASNSSAAEQGYVIYAYNIGAQTTQEELTDLFSLYGTVTKVDVIWDYLKHMGKGYGFVTMPDYEEAAYAIQCLNGYNYAGKPLQVSFKTPKA